MKWPKHGDERNGERYDRPSMAWISVAEWEERDWRRKEAAFMRATNQGDLCCPRIITDGQGGIRGVQSMLDGKMYDSKSNMRRHYRERGATEVGDDSSVTDRDKIFGPQKRYEDPKHDQKIEAALGRAWSRVGLPA